VSSVSRVLVQLEVKPGDPKTSRLVITDDGISINDKGFGWGSVDKILYRAVDHYQSAAYQGTTFTIGAGDVNQKAVFTLRANPTSFWKPEIDQDKRTEQHEHWKAAVEILDAQVGVRLAAHAVVTVRQGGTAKFAGLHLDPQGVHKRGVFSKSIAWPEVAGTEIRQSYFCVLARHGEKTKPRIQILRDGWNVVLLPRVIGALSG
jgi:hypothetical protein